MFSSAPEKQEIDEIFETFKEPDIPATELDVVVENYLALVNQLQGDLKTLRSELAHHKKVHGEITDSLDEFFTIQRLSSIITENLEYEQIIKNLDEISQKVIPHNASQVFFWKKNEIDPVFEDVDADLSLIVQNMQEEGILNWLWDQGHPIVIPIRDFVVYDQLENQKGNLVIAPMMQGQEGMGLYLLHTDKNQAEFSFRDLELLNILTQQAAIAIQYTRLFKKLEHTHEALKNSQARLMQTVKLATVGELAGGIAHEINNPLQIILGNIQMALMGYKTEDSLKIVETQAMRIANIVRGLLSMARQNKSSTPEYLEINPLIMNTLNLVRGQIEKRGIQFDLQLEDNLPLIKGSSIYFQQILLNFVLHSKRQIERNGSIAIHSSLTTDEQIQIEIKDSGVSMPKEYIQKILYPFEDMDNSTEINLGLSVSVQMIQDIGGTVNIHSDEGGNRVAIQIPRIRQNEDNYGEEAVSTG